MNPMIFETRVESNHLFHLPEDLPVNTPIRIYIETLQHDRVTETYQPRTPLGQQLLEIRRHQVEAGGKLLNEYELDAEI